MRFACDGVLADPDDALWRAVTVDAPAAVVFRWLCQLRVAPYSYDLIDNLGRRSPQQLTPGLAELEAGQRVMTIFTLVSFERDAQITVRITRARARRIFGDVVVTYAVLRAGDGGTRLVAKLVVRHARGPVGWLMRAVLPWGDLVMMRRQLLNLRRLAEARV